MRLLSLLLILTVIPFGFIWAQQTSPGDTSDTFSPDWDWTPEQFMANELAYSLGGQKVWKDKSWNIAFDVVLISGATEEARYGYQWNRATNQCIVVGKTPDGRVWRVEFSDIKNSSGQASVEGKPVAEADLPQILSMTYSRLKSDLHTLFLPFELLGQDVKLAMAPDTTFGGRDYLLWKSPSVPILRWMWGTTSGSISTL